MRSLSMARLARRAFLLYGDIDMYTRSASRTGPSNSAAVVRWSFIETLLRPRSCAQMSAPWQPILARVHRKAVLLEG